MFKIKKKTPSAKLPVLYNIIEDYTEHDAPGNVTVCAMTQPEDAAGHAKVLAESYEVPLEEMTELLSHGGVYQYPQEGSLITRGLFVCRVDPDEQQPKHSWVLDLMQFSEAEQLARSQSIPLAEAAARVFYRSLPSDLQRRLEEKNLGLDYGKLDRSVAKWGDIKFIDFRKDWSPYFKRLCIMPDGEMIETGGLKEFAELHDVAETRARTLLEQGGILEVDGEVLACQIINNQPAVARFNAAQYTKAKALVEEKGLHIMDALSEVGLSDPRMMRALRRRELQN
ncbi:hypothetical protein YTPLAS18_16910 [Nitrospira sp.]|nr:hypothetical protein YTPLAS18_16910 [Nitrospira sp.]